MARRREGAGLAAQILSDEVRIASLRGDGATAEALAALLVHAPRLKCGVAASLGVVAPEVWAQVCASKDPMDAPTTSWAGERQEPSEASEALERLGRCDLTALHSAQTEQALEEAARGSP